MKFKYDVEYKDNRPWKVVAIGTSKYGEIYIGEARCASEDKFDFEVGARIARMRAELKQLNRIMKNAEASADRYFEKGNQAAMRRIKAYQSIVKICNELEENY